MPCREAGVYHILILWPWRDDAGVDRIGHALRDLGGVPAVPGLDRLFGFATAWGRDEALERVRSVFGPGSVRAAGVVAERSITPDEPGPRGEATAVRRPAS